MWACHCSDHWCYTLHTHTDLLLSCMWVLLTSTSFLSSSTTTKKNSRLSKRTKENKRNYECTAVWYLDLLTMSFFFLLIHTYMLAFTFLHHFTLAIGNFAERTFLRQWGCCCWWWSWRKYQHYTYCYHHHHKTMLMMMILRFFILYTTSLCFLPLSKNCLFNKTSLSIIITHTSKPSKLLRYHRHPP